MDAIPRDVIECAILDGQIPQCGEGAEWCEQHGNCYRCAKDIHDMLVEEVRCLKAERDEYLESCHLWEFKCKSMVELPRDADGEPIHVGDKVVEVDEPAVPRTVTSINLVGDGWWVYINGVGRRSDKYRHVKQPTVEDVLRQFLGECESAANIGYDEVPQEVFDDYATKLRLAGDDE